jgi:DNA-binding transcriptional LysR family regulator
MIAVLSRTTRARDAYVVRTGQRETLPISFSVDRGAPAWSFGSGKKKAYSVHPRERLIVNSSEVALEAAVAGAGLTRVLSYMAAADVKAGRLRVILREFEPEPIPIHVIHREGKRAAARVRAFVDLAVDRLRSHPLLKS